MGAYLRKPITDKTSESGEYTYCGRKIIYASTAVQGWRISMEVGGAIVYVNVDNVLATPLNSTRVLSMNFCLGEAISQK